MRFPARRKHDFFEITVAASLLFNRLGRQFAGEIEPAFAFLVHSVRDHVA